MTIRLIFPYQNSPSGATVDLDYTTESSLVAQGLAAYIFNPSAQFYPLTSAEQQQLRKSVLELSRVVDLSPSSGSGIQNSALLQSAINANQVVSIEEPGIYRISAPINVPSNVSVKISRGVVLVKVDDATNSGTIFQNSDMVNGNVNISITGEGVLYCNANSYAAAFAANSADCPVLPTAMNSIAALTSPAATLYVMNGIHMENVNGLTIGGGLTVMMAPKYQIYGASLQNFSLDGVQFYTDDTVNPANGSTAGRDGIHIQGLTQKGLIRNITGTVNDDFVVLNCRDVDSYTSTRSVGYIRDVIIEKIRGKNQRRSGAGVALYTGQDTGTLSGGKDTAPAISTMSQSGDVVTVTTATAHAMVVGQRFTISSSNPAGYNITNGKVASVVSTTQFTFYNTAGLGAYVGSAVMVRKYMMDQIVVRDVDQTTTVGNGVMIGATGSTTAGILTEPLLENIRGIATAPTSDTGVVGGNYATIDGGTIRNVVSYNPSAHPCINFSFNSMAQIGHMLIERPSSAVPYKPNSGNGVGWLQLPLTYEHITIRGASVDVEDGGGGWRHAIGGGCSGGLLVLDGCDARPTPGNQVFLFYPQQAAMGQVEIRQPGTNASCIWAHIQGGVTSGNVRLTGAQSAGRSTAAINYFGTTCTIQIDNCNTGAFSGGMISSSTAGTLTVSAWGNQLSNSLLFSGASTGGAAGFQIMGDTQCQVDGTKTYLGTNVGNTFWNTNAGFSAGIGYYGRTNAGAWTRVY